jgi:hypothetical protein
MCEKSRSRIPWLTSIVVATRWVEAKAAAPGTG